MSDDNSQTPNTHGRMRLEAILRARPGKPLEHGETLLFHHALRCLCRSCSRLLNWETDDHVLVSECCGLQYRLLPRSVAVSIEDVSSRPILPAMRGSDYSNPSTDLSKLFVGETTVLHEQKSGPLSNNQKGLRRPKTEELTQSSVNPNIRLSRPTKRSSPRKIKLKTTFSEAGKTKKLK